MYTIFTNRYYILEFLKNKKKLEFVYCEKNSFAEIFCKKKILIILTTQIKKIHLNS